MNSLQKRQYIRSKKLLKLVSELNCQHCGAENMTQAAHTNWGGGKGRGIKADDNLVAALCLKCHYEIDQGAKMSRDQRQEIWLNAHRKTVKVLLSQNKWPIDIPVPEVPEWV
jgi:transcription elongation factor Elf1